MWPFGKRKQGQRQAPPAATIVSHEVVVTNNAPANTPAQVARCLARLKRLRASLDKANDPVRVQEVSSSISVYKGKLMAAGYQIPNDSDAKAWADWEAQYGIE